MGFVVPFIKIRDQPMGRQVCLTMPQVLQMGKDLKYLNGLCVVIYKN
jgi:hypothetical protein